MVNNAGVCIMDPVDESSTKDFSNQLETNVLGTFHILKHLSPFLIENETHIVTISSIAANHGYPNVGAYCSSKFAVKGLIESCKKEWKEQGIRFSSLVPGAINTPLWDKLEVNWDRDKMLSVEDFLHVFEMVIKSPKCVQFPELVFLHKEGILI